MDIRTKIASMKKFYKEDIHGFAHGFQKNTLHMTGAACLGSFLIGTGKVYIALLSMSIFTFVSALYTYAIVGAKAYILYGLAQTQNNIVEQFTYYKRSGYFLVIAGIAYIFYAIKLYLYPTVSSFDQNMALSISFFTFVELGLNIRGIIVERKNAMPLFHALKIINLASSCICLVLTQTALLAYTSAQTTMPHDASSNGLIGILMGFFSTLLGVYMMLRTSRIIQGKDVQRVAKKIARLSKKQHIDISFEIMDMHMRTDGKRDVEVRYTMSLDEAMKKHFASEVLHKLNIVLFENHDTIREKEILQ